MWRTVFSASPTTCKEATIVKNRFSAAKVLTYAVLAFWALTTIYPFVWVILNSFQAEGTHPYRFVFAAAWRCVYL